MNGLVVALALAITPWTHPDDPIIDCAILELNTYGQQGSTQLIIWDWQPQRLHVRHWQFWCGGELKPRKVDGKYHVWIEYSGDDYLIRALKISETRTAHDPEVLDRMYLPVEMRRGL